MSVTVKGVIKHSPASGSGIKSGDQLLKINGNEIMDVLDYRFYQNDRKLRLDFIDDSGKTRHTVVKKNEYDELGLEFETYLMDKKHSCKNKCVFCFIDQLPPGLRESLYFKDDDSRLSFLFGNYITLTNISDHEIERIIKMHISPVNISVHTTDPELRVRMMKNKNAGKALEIMKKFNEAGIKLNCQLVLCPGINDGEALKRTLDDLLELENAESIAAVPVGLTDFREGLEKLEPFDRKTAYDTVKLIEDYGEMSVYKYGERRFFASDELYLTAGIPLHGQDYYGEFRQLENGVGLLPLLLYETSEAIEDSDVRLETKRKISLVTGVAAYPFIREIVDKMTQKWNNLECNVICVKNSFFGERITVAGLLTAKDIEYALKGVDIGEELLIPGVALRSEGDMFLDSVTTEELSAKIGVKITPVSNDGYEFTDHILGNI